MQNKITLVIPFLNEKDELVKTIDSAMQTCSVQPDIIIVNDGSADDINNAFKDANNIKIIKNEKTLGTSMARERGIEMAKTPYIVTTDAHVRFHDKNWDKQVIDKIKAHKQSVFCFACKNVQKKETYYAGGMHYFPKANQDLMLTPFLLRHSAAVELSDVPAVIGGSYALYLPWYKHLMGMHGMQGWGVGETFLSIKSWLAGGSCKVDKSIRIGHVFKKPNYAIDKSNFYYNKMWLCRTILPCKYTSYAMFMAKPDKNKQLAIDMIVKNNLNILKDQIHYENILHVDFQEIVKKFKIDSF